jgi:hypothetical protein
MKFSQTHIDSINAVAAELDDNQEVVVNLGNDGTVIVTKNNGYIFVYWTRRGETHGKLWSQV